MANTKALETGGSKQKFQKVVSVLQTKDGIDLAQDADGIVTKSFTLQSILKELIVQLEILNAYQEIITDTKITENDIKR